MELSEYLALAREAAREAGMGSSESELIERAAQAQEDEHE